MEINALKNLKKEPKKKKVLKMTLNGNFRYEI